MKRKRKNILSPLAQGKKIGAWSLTEPEAGSDAGGTRTTAVRDGELGVQWRQNIHHQRTLRGYLRGHGRDRQIQEGRTASAHSFWKKACPGLNPGKKKTSWACAPATLRKMIFTDCRVPR